MTGEAPGQISSTSLSHSNGVSSAKADQALPSSEADSLPARGMASPLRVVTKKSQLQWMTFNIPAIISYLVCGYVICHLTYNHILCLAPLILHLSLALECIQLHEDYFTWHELHGTSCPVIVPFLPVCFAVGLKVRFNISLLKALSYFSNVRGDMAGVHMGTHCLEKEIHWEMWAFPKHQIMR